MKSFRTKPFKSFGIRSNKIADLIGAGEVPVFLGGLTLCNKRFNLVFR